MGYCLAGSRFGVAGDDVEQCTGYPAEADSAGPRGIHERFQGLVGRSAADTNEDADH